MAVVLLAGGTGGAKLACGFRDLLHDGLTVIANTGDDIEIYGAYVSPDPDLATYRLAGALDDRGYGIAGDSHDAMASLKAAGEDVWFTLGDRDLDVCRKRAVALAVGRTLTQAHAEVTAEFDTGGATVLPMSDDLVRTEVQTADGWRGLQQFLILDGANVPIKAVRFVGAQSAKMTDQVRTAVLEADLIVVGPSNPIISIGPILAVPGLAELIIQAPAPVVAVSPFVSGRAVKGPTEAFMAAAGWPEGPEGIVAAYRGLIDGLVTDQPVDLIPNLVTDVLIDNDTAAQRLATEMIEFGKTLVGGR